MMENISFARAPTIAYVVELPNVDPAGQTHGTASILQEGRDVGSGLPTTIAGSRTAAAEMTWHNIVFAIKWKEVLASLMIGKLENGCGMYGRYSGTRDTYVRL